MPYNIFTHLKQPRDLTGYTLLRGTPDFTQLQAFDMFEAGFPYLVVVSIPDFLQKMADRDEEVRTLLDSYTHILEYEFLGLDGGIDNLTTDTQEITNNLQSINIITKTSGITGTTFTMRYKEKSGSILTRVHELYLRSLRDPASGFKHYGGLIGTDEMSTYKPHEAGYDRECFSFLYMHTDNTGLALERAIYYVGCMPTTAELNTLYNNERGNVEFKEVGLEFQGFPIHGAAVNKRAREILDWMNSTSNTNMVVRNSYNYEYADINDKTKLAKQSLSNG